MYIPKHFEEHDKRRIVAFARKYAFATLVTVRGGLPHANHFPLMIEENERLLITGHMAKANEQWRHLQEDNQVLIIFQGPHTYISPSNYKESGVPPTWNYASIHMYGVATVFEGKEKLKSVLESLADKYEKSQRSPWVPEYPSEMLEAIVGFDVVVDRIEAKYKLSQNRPEADRKTIISNLTDLDSESDKDIATLMNENELHFGAG